MENNIKNRLMEIRRRTALVQTVSSYTKTLSDLFVNDIALFESVCDNYDATAEEMLELLANASYKNVAFLDEIIQYSCKYIEENNKELKR